MKKKVILFFDFVLIIILGIIGVFLYHNSVVQKEQEQIRINLIEKINFHYSEYVITNKDAILYDKNKNEVGKISKDIIINLKKIIITENDEYLYIPLLNSYIYYEDVDKSEKKDKDDRYKFYIPFNLNFKSKDNFKLYNSEDIFLYNVNKSIDSSIIIKDEDRYGFIFDDELVYIKKEDIIDEYENINTNKKNKEKIRTLTYHFFYDSNTESCNDILCKKISELEEEAKYLRENNYFTLTMEELELYIDGKLQIPEKSIVLTIDDGTRVHPGIISVLEKYKVNATLFVITGWVDPFKLGLVSDYLELESHTDNMHNVGECPNDGVQGGGILCKSEEYVIKDLKLTQKKLKGSVYFAFPFFEFNDRAINALKKAGFHMSFVGQLDTDGFSYPLITDKYKIRRKSIFSNDSFEKFKSYLN